MAFGNPLNFPEKFASIYLKFLFGQRLLPRRQFVRSRRQPDRVRMWRSGASWSSTLTITLGMVKSSKRLSELVASWVSVTDSFLVFVSELVDTNTQWSCRQFDVVKVRLV